MNICVVGTGYVGLVTGAVFADLGNNVVCVDKDRDKIAALEAGRMPIYEPGLEEMVARNAGDSRLSFTSDLGVGIRHALLSLNTSRASAMRSVTRTRQIAVAAADAWARSSMLRSHRARPMVDRMDSLAGRAFGATRVRVPPGRRCYPTGGPDARGNVKKM